MKKLVVFIIVVLCLVVSLYYPKNVKQILNLDNSGKYELYINNQFNEKNSNLSYTNLGSGEVVTGMVKSIKDVYDYLIGKDGECLTVNYNKYFLDDLLSKIVIKVTENYDNTKIYYGFLKGLPKKIKINGKLINISIYVNSNEIKIASPIILTSF